MLAVCIGFVLFMSPSFRIITYNVIMFKDYLAGWFLMGRGDEIFIWPVVATDSETIIIINCFPKAELKNDSQIQEAVAKFHKYQLHLL